MASPQKVKELSYDPAGHNQNTESLCPHKTCIQMFVAALFIIASKVKLGFLGGSAGKESACKAGDLGLIPWLGRSPGEGKGYILQYSGLEYLDCVV